VAAATDRFADMSEILALAATTCKKNLAKPKKATGQAAGKPKMPAGPATGEQRCTYVRTECVVRWQYAGATTP
jgi:hypothetical protein